MSTKTNNRVFIRPPRLEDWDAFILGVRCSRELHSPWITPKAKTKEEFAGYLKRFSSGQHHGHFIIHRASGGVVGVININDVIRGAFQSASLGYYAFAPYAGQGLMYEGMLLVLRRAFKELKLHRLEANIQPDNLASIALVKKCGFVREGFSRRMLKVRGRWKDHERWALLAEDFNSR